MKHEKNVLYKKINEAMIIFMILFPVVGIFFVIMTIWALGEQARQKFPCLFQLSAYFFSFLHSYYISTEKKSG